MKATLPRRNTLNECLYPHKKATANDSHLCDIVTDYQVNERARTAAEAESRARCKNVQKNRRFGKLVENRCQIYLSRYSSNDIPLLRSNYVNFQSEDNSAEAQHAKRVHLSAQKKATAE